MVNIKPPPVRRHSIIYRQVGNILGKFVLVAALVYFKLRGLPRDPRARALIVWHEEVLLVKNIADFNLWTLPGGGKKTGEDYQQAAAREIHEELGLPLPAKAYRPLGYYIHHEIDTDFDLVCFHLDLALITAPWLNLATELLDARWFRHDALPPNTSPVARRCITDYFKP